MLPNKPFNMPMPKSQLNGGSNLDEGCGDIGQAEAGMDEVFGEMIQSAAQQIEASPPGQAIAQGYNAGDESNSEAVSNLGGAVGSLVEIPAEAAATAAGNAAGALMMESDGRKKRTSGRDTTEFTRATTTHGRGPDNGAPPPLMSEAGKKLAAKSAPQSAYKTTTTGKSAVDGLSNIPQAEGGKGLGALRGMTVTGELEKARKGGRYYEPAKFTTVKH